MQLCLCLSVCLPACLPLSLSLSLSLSVLTTICPGEDRLAGFIGVKVVEVVVTIEAISRIELQLKLLSLIIDMSSDVKLKSSSSSIKAPVKSSSSTNQHPTFYRPDALPVAESTVSKH